MGGMHTSPIMTSSPVPLAEWELQSQIQQALSSKLTGQIQVVFLNGRTESIFVQHGIVQSLYVRNHRLPDLNWKAPLEHHGTGTLVIEPLPGRALMFRKVILEEITQSPPQRSGTAQLQSMFSLAEYNPTPTLFHIQWETAQAFVLVAGGHISIQHAVLITPSHVEEGSAALEHILAWEETGCNVAVHRSDIKNQAWLELQLNVLLEWYCQKILSHYQQLTGVVMVKSILQSVAVLAENKGLELSTHHQHLTDASIFPGAAAARNAYREVFSTIRSRIEPIIGSSLTNYLMRQAIESTRGIYKTIQESFDLVEDTQ
jgi:hypothetical protein